MICISDIDTTCSVPCCRVTFQVLDIDLEELPDIFDILDDGDGAITTEESLVGQQRGVAVTTGNPERIRNGGW